MSGRRAGQRGLGLLGVCAVGALLYADTLHAPFVFDDYQNIVDNRAIRIADLGPRSLLRAAFASPSPRPVANLSFALNYYAGGYAVEAYRAVNIAIHLANALLVFALVRFALAAARARPRESSGTAGAWETDGPALFAALCFVAHPLQTQSVSYVVQRMTSLATFFYLGGVLLYLRGRLVGCVPTDRTWLRGACFALAGVAWLLAMGSKQIAATFPFALLLSEWLLLQSGRPRWLRRHAKWLLVPLPVLAALVYVYGVDALLRLDALRDFGPVERMLTQLRVVTLYLGLVLWPSPSRLNLLHDIAPSRSLLEPVTTLVCLALLFALLVAAFRQAPRRPLIAFGVLWFFLHLALESSFLPLELVFEHRTYLPLAGGVLLAALLLRAGLARWRRASTAVAIGVVAALCAGTLARNQVWESPERVWRDVIAKSPQLPRAHANLGAVLVGARRYDEGIAALARALELEPGYAKAHYFLGWTSQQRGRPAEAVAHYREALRHRPRDVLAMLGLAESLLALGEHDAAERQLTELLERSPHHPGALRGLARLLEQRGEPDAALRHYLLSLRSDPANGSAHARVGALRGLRGQHRAAVFHLAKALEAGDPSAANDLAWIYATTPVAALRNSEAAVELASAAAHRHPRDPEIADTLAAAYAAAGRFDAAAQTARAAVAAAEALGAAALASDVRERLALYERGRAYTEPVRSDASVPDPE